MTPLRVRVEATPAELEGTGLRASWAVYDDQRSCRFELGRTWGGDPDNYLTCVGLNPSTAGHLDNDPTVRILTRLANRWDFDGLRVLNLHPLITPSPKELHALRAESSTLTRNAKGERIDPVPLSYVYVLNENSISQALLRRRLPDGGWSRTQTTLAFWGAGAAKARGVAYRCWQLLRTSRVYALGVTKDGHPWHPLRKRLPERGHRWPVLDHPNADQLVELYGYG